MKKVSLRLGRINRGILVSFNLIIESSVDSNVNNMKLISYNNFGGNEYISINPTPYVTIDISDKMSKKTEGYNPSRSVNLNGFNLFRLACVIKKMLKGFMNSNLYYYNDTELVVDPQLAKSMTEIISLNEKKVMMRPVVVPGENDNNSYEGCIFSINSLNCFQYLTIDELRYLYDVLIHINMSQLSLEVMNLIGNLDVSEDEVIIENRSGYGKESSFPKPPNNPLPQI